MQMYVDRREDWDKNKTTRIDWFEYVITMGIQPEVIFTDDDSFNDYKQG